MDLFRERQRDLRLPPVRYDNSGEVTIGQNINATLLPFRSVMSKLLRRRGYDTSSMDMATITALYHNEFVNSKEPVDVRGFTSNPLYQIRASDNWNGDLGDYRNRAYWEQIEGVVDGTINHFVAARRKRDAVVIIGGDNYENNLTGDEETQAAAVDTVQAKLTASQTSSAPFTQKQFWDVAKIVLIVMAIYYIFT
jgi:hypothetical protein